MRVKGGTPTRIRHSLEAEAVLCLDALARLTHPAPPRDSPAARRGRERSCGAA